MDDTVKIVLIVIISIAIISVFVVFYFTFLRKVFLKSREGKKFRNVCGSLVYKVALDNDYYLINQLILPLSDTENMHIDHLLFGDKFIYLITDRFYNGVIEGKPDDNSWFIIGEKDKKIVDNPLKTNKIRLEKLALISNFNSKFLISVVIVNDESLLHTFDTESDSDFVVNYSRFKKLIKAVESRNVDKIDDNQLKFAVKDMARLNERKKVH